MVTDKMVEAFANSFWPTSSEIVIDRNSTYIRAALEAALSVSDAGPIAWESTTVCYTKYVTDARYQKFSDKVKKWYKPYRCSSCAAPPAVAVKALEWVDEEHGWYSTKGVFDYAYEVRVTDRGSVRIRYGNHCWEDFDGTLEAAKAAAQADYVSRIRSALA